MTTPGRPLSSPYGYPRRQASGAQLAVRIVAAIAFGVHFAQYFFVGAATDEIGGSLRYWAGIGDGQWDLQYADGAEKAARIFGNVETWVLLVLLIVVLLPSKESRRDA